MSEEFPEEQVKSAADRIVGKEGAEELPWWEANFLLRERIQDPPTEAYKFKLGGKSLDLLNFHEVLLSEDERAQLVKTLEAVALFTQGKIMDRLIGVVCAGEESFRVKDGEDSQERPSVSGDLNRANPVVMLNLDAFRNPLDDSFPRFIAHRIHSGVSMLEFVFAHEMGHAMDLSYLSEVDRHGFDKDKVNPNWEAWGDSTKSFTAFEHPDPSIHSGEPGLSSRARSSAVEDFAETFAIATLGGGVSAVPNKMHRLIETIQLAKGQTIEGSLAAHLEKIT